jgi:FAD/FMN-containing dehydrogenase
MTIHSVPAPPFPGASLGPSLIWRNWVSNQVCRVAHFAMPSSEEQVCALIRAAAERGLRLRVVGTGHSYTPIVVTDDVLMSAERLTGIESIDAEKGHVTMRGGTRICDVGPALRAAGWALPNQGDIDLQTITGAVSTGTHGSGDDLQCLAGPIAAMRIATADGGILEVSEERDADILGAAKVALGMLGVVVSVTMRLVPAFDLHDRVWRADFDECLDELDELCRTNRSVRLFWCPTEHSASLFSLPDTYGLGRTRRIADVCEVRVLNATTEAPDSVAGRRGEAIGPSYRIFPGSIPMPNHNECEYAVPYEDGPAVFRAVRDLVQRKHPDQIFPVEYRTVAPDDIWLSPYHQRRTAMISVAGGAGEDYWAFIRDCEAIFAEVKGRPHWGKLHTLDRAAIAALYPRHEAFVALRRRLDPQGRFLNRHLEERFG